MIRRNLSAASTVVAALLMVSITVTGAVVAYTWASHAFGRWQQVASEQFEIKSEAIAIESLALIGSDAQIIVRNTGTIPVGIASIYVDSVLKYTAPSPQGFIIQIGNATAFTLPSVSDGAHLISVITARGYRQAGYWIPARGLTTTTASTTQTTTTITFTTTYTTTTTSTGTTTYTTTTYGTTTSTTTSRGTDTYTTTITSTTTSRHGNDYYTITTTRTTTVTSSSTTTITTTSTTSATSTTTSTGTTTITSTVTTTRTTSSTQP
jgi:hypothetical protein